MISDGKYEILFENNLVPEISGDGEIYQSKVVCEINGADVNFADVDLKFKIHWEKVDEKVSYLSVRMPNDEAKLSSFFYSSPYGLIKKNKTGIGATTLELRSKRNSIIVVPTKALAYEKAKNSKDEKGKYTILYRGSHIEGFTPPTLQTYLTYNDVEYKKILVVADSLPSLLDEIGENAYKDYFLMVDEIDSYQYDISYRPNLEKVIDCYFKFPQTRRCLVSATIGEFSNPQIENEATISITFNQPQTRAIRLEHTDNALITTKRIVGEIRKSNPDDYIVIAFNSIEGIMQVAALLGQKEEENISVLCGADSIEAVSPFYSEINNGNLTKPITFMTCSFFVGIDIAQRFHLISVADTSIPHSLLSTNKLQQIAGRCRHQDGLLSEYVVYTTNQIHFTLNEEALRKQLIQDAQALKEYTLITTRIENNKYLKELLPQNVIFNEDDFIKESTPKYIANSRTLPLIRKGLDGLEISYFAIDNYLIQLNLQKSLYSTPEKLEEQLRQEGHNVTYYNSTEEPTTEEKSTQNDVITKRRISEEEQWQNIIGQLKQSTSIEEREKAARVLKKSKEYTLRNRKKLGWLISLHKYVKLEILAEKMYQIESEGAYKVFYDKTLIWALSDKHPLKIAIHAKFPIGQFLYSSQIHDGMNDIWHGMWGFPPLSPSGAPKKLSYFAKKSGRTSLGIRGKNANGYSILSYDTNDFGVEPLEKIPSGENILNYFKSIS